MPPTTEGDAEAAVLGRPRVHLRRTDSTNERARELAAAGAPHGTLVSAAEQTAGRGRQGRSWTAPAGGALLCSLVLRDPPALLSLIAGIAVCDAVDRRLPMAPTKTARAPSYPEGHKRGTGGRRALVKWPNDVVFVDATPKTDRTQAFTKVAGILVEGRPQEGWAVLGIGLNVAVRTRDLPPELRERAASLGLAPSAIEPTLSHLLEALERRLAEPAEGVLDAWRARDALRGRDVSWAQGPPIAGGRHGRAEGIDGAGRLLVRLDDGATTALGAGEVHLASVG
jgi:BirA family biotin operon repressor/biotin-[acetyl-CoA-carboxylase] ligase